MFCKDFCQFCLLARQWGEPDDHFGRHQERRARGSESSGHAILSVGFGVKLDLLAHCFEGSRQKSWVLQERHEIRILRNNVAHGAPLPDVMQLPGQVRNLIQLRTFILDRIAELRVQDS